MWGTSWRAAGTGTESNVEARRVREYTWQVTAKTERHAVRGKLLTRFSLLKTGTRLRDGVSLICLLLALLFVARPAEAQSFEQFVQMATQARQESRLAEAIEYYERTIRIREDWAEGWWHLGTLHYELGAFDEARNFLQGFLRLEGDSAPGSLLLGLCDFEAGDYEAALESLLRGLAPGSGAPDELVSTGRLRAAQLLSRAGRFEESFVELFDLAYQRPGDLSVSDALGIAALRLPHLPREVPRHQVTMVRLAGQSFGYLADFRLSEARTQYRELVERFPEVRLIPSANPDSLLSRGTSGGFPLNFATDIVSAEDVELGDDDLVIGVEIEGRARAYPVNYMNGPMNEVVNDQLGDRPLAATW